MHLKTKEEVTQYIRDYFDSYELDDFDFFFAFKDSDIFDFDDEVIPIPLFPYDEMDNITLSRISTHTGLTIKEILNCSAEAAVRYEIKYPFIKLFRSYCEKWRWYARFKSQYLTPMEHLLKTIYLETDEPPVERRYDFASVEQRMIEKLEEIEFVMPGTYHLGAKITNLTIQTEVFFSFPQCKEMLSSFIDMVSRLETLFFKALRSDLTDDEQNELNFLASYLHAKDAVMPSVLVTHDNICRYRPAYLEEDLTDFFSYVKINSFIISSPWRCQEFLDDMDLVQKFVTIFPQTKAQMRQFAMDVTKFLCVFVWSDAKPIMDSLEEEAEWAAMLEKIGDKPIPLEKRAKERTRVYVEKTKDEMFGWEVYAKRLSEAASPVSKGGLVLPQREIELHEPNSLLSRIERRISAKNRR